MTTFLPMLYTIDSSVKPFLPRSTKITDQYIFTFQRKITCLTYVLLQSCLSVSLSRHCLSACHPVCLYMGLSVFFPFPSSVQFLLPILFIAALPTSVCWPSCLSCLSVFQWLHLCCPFVSLSVWLLICLSFWSLACCPNCTYFCVLSLGCPACLSTCLGILSVCLLI